MNGKQLLKQINSIYIVKNILQCIKNEDFKLKLFLYSKYFQTHLQFGIEEYLEIVLRKKNINLYNYLNLEKDPKYAQTLKELNKKEINKNIYIADDILKSQLKTDLLNNRIDFKIGKKLVMNYFNKHLKK